MVLANGADSEHGDGGEARVFRIDDDTVTTLGTVWGEHRDRDVGEEGVFADGDLNGDGDDDLVVGSEYLPAAVIYGPITGLRGPARVDDDDTADIWVSTAAHCSRSPSDELRTGDLNNDGVVDLISLEPGCEPDGDSNDGWVYVFYSDRAGGRDHSEADVVITGSTSESLGQDADVGDVNGDVNGDGLADLLMAGDGGNDASDPSVVSLFLGPLDRSHHDSSDADLRIWGERDTGSHDMLLGTLASRIVGDLDGDGTADLALTSIGTAATDIVRGVHLYRRTDTGVLGLTDDWGKLERVSVRDGQGIDLDQDGAQDLLLSASMDGVGPVVIYGPIEPGVHQVEDAASASWADPERSIWGSKAVDCDSDGNLDLVTLHQQDDGCMTGSRCATLSVVSGSGL